MHYAITSRTMYFSCRFHRDVNMLPFPACSGGSLNEQTTCAGLTLSILPFCGTFFAQISTKEYFLLDGASDTPLTNN